MDGHPREEACPSRSFTHFVPQVERPDCAKAVAAQAPMRAIEHFMLRSDVENSRNIRRANEKVEDCSNREGSRSSSSSLRRDNCSRGDGAAEWTLLRLK